MKSTQCLTVALTSILPTRCGVPESPAPPVPVTGLRKHQGGGNNYLLGVLRDATIAQHLESQMLQAVLDGLDSEGSVDAFSNGRDNDRADNRAVILTITPSYTAPGQPGRLGLAAEATGVPSP